MVQYILSINQSLTSIKDKNKIEYANALKSADHDYDIWLNHRQARGLPFIISQNTLQKFENALTINLEDIDLHRYFGYDESLGKKVDEYLLLTNQYFVSEKRQQVRDKYGYAEYENKRNIFNNVIYFFRDSSSLSEYDFDHKGHFYVMDDTSLNELLDENIAFLFNENPKTFTWGQLFTKLEIKSSDYFAKKKILHKSHYKFLSLSKFSNVFPEFVTEISIPMKMYFYDELISKIFPYLMGISYEHAKSLYHTNNFYNYVVKEKGFNFEFDTAFNPEEIIEFLYNKYNYSDLLIKSATKN